MVVGGGVEYYSRLTGPLRSNISISILAPRRSAQSLAMSFIDRMPFDNNFSTVRAGINYHLPV